MGYTSNSNDNCLMNGINTVIGQDVNKTNVTLATAIEEAAKDYEVLYHAHIARMYHHITSAPFTPIYQVKTTKEFVNFRAKMAFLLHALWSRDGGDPYSEWALKIGMGVLPLLTANMTEGEVKFVVQYATRWHLGQELKTEPFTSTGDFPVTGPFYKGLRIFNGQETIMRALRAAGLDVYIVSASPANYVRAASSLGGLGYEVPDDHVHGVKFKADAAGRATTEYEDNFPISWGPGKATIVNSVLKPLHNGSAAIYGSGDSEGDCEMLSTVRDGVVHVIDRLQGSSTCIQKYYTKAWDFFNKTEPATNNFYVIQGQDETIGSWIVAGLSTKDGINYDSGQNLESAKYVAIWWHPLLK